MKKVLLPEPVYIAGPMTGLPERNYPEFRMMEGYLRSQGFTQVENPCQWDDDPNDDTHEWGWYVRRGLRQLLDCESLVLLPGWDASHGATVERFVAITVGMVVVDMTDPDVALRPAS